MKELTIEEKAKAYDEALKVLHKYDGANIMFSQSLKEEMFPELEESEDERIRKNIINFINNPTLLLPYKKKEYIAWLEKREHTDSIIEKAKTEKQRVILTETDGNANIDWDTRSLEDARRLLEYGLQYINTELKKQGEITSTEDFGEFINILSKQFPEVSFAKLSRIAVRVKKWLEKQGTERKQLYVRFGDIPSNEKSKIYRGEEEIGEENGVSVYPAFELNGNIILGLTLPITRTTLYTQQHLLEYDNRPCYLVSGDYVGSGTDGEPLIRNISIIKRLDNYRIKEIEKQGEQKVSVDDFKAKDWYVSKVDGKIHNIYYSVDKVKPKFKVGDWIVSKTSNLVYRVDSILLPQSKCYYLSHNGGIVLVSFADEQNYRLWSIQDAKDGDVLKEDSCTFIIERMKHDETAIIHCCLFDDGDFDLGSTLSFDVDSTYPATKEQRDLLFQKMREAGYEWDAEKKELKKIDKENLTEFEIAVKNVMEEAIEAGDTHNLKADAENLLRITQPTWGEDDEKLAQAKKDAYNDALDKIEYHSGEPTFDDGWDAAIWYLKKKG